MEPGNPRGRIEGNRVFRALPSLGLVAVLIGAILVVGWLLVGSSLTIPRFSTTGPVVRNGVAVIVACGEKQGIEGMGAAMDYAPEPGTGTWAPVRKGECTVWYHHPPDATQREARHRRADAERAAQSFVWACGRKVLAEDRVFVRGMRKDCGIYGEDTR